MLLGQTAALQRAQHELAHVHRVATTRFPNPFYRSLLDRTAEHGVHEQLHRATVETFEIDPAHPAPLPCRVQAGGQCRARPYRCHQEQQIGVQ